MIEIIVKKFNKLSLEELYYLLQLRSEVFVVEQNCVYQDIDGKDYKSLHVIAKRNNKIIAYTRLFNKGDYFKEASIGRVVVAKNLRHFNYGSEIMEASIDAIKKISTLMKLRFLLSYTLKVFIIVLVLKQQGVLI